MITPTLPAKFHALETEMNTRILERHSEVRTAIIAILAKVHHFQIGPPGVSKSMLVTTLHSLIEDSIYYENLMTTQTKIEELVGPISFKALNDDRIRFNTDGFLPTAYFAFLDEIFKSSRSTLNALLTLLNERKMRNDGEIVKTPLISMFCASNELPAESEALAALYDRIHFRHVVQPIREGGAFVDMLKLETLPPVPVVSMADIQEAHNTITTIQVKDEVYDGMWDLRERLHKDNVPITDRRFKEAMKVIKASAFYRGSPVAEMQDIRLCHHMFWNNPGEEQLRVEKMVIGAASPLDERATKLKNDLLELSRNLDDKLASNPNKAERRKISVIDGGKMQQARNELNAIRAEMEKCGAVSEIVPQVDSILRGLGKRVVELMGIKEEE